MRKRHNYKSIKQNPQRDKSIVSLMGIILVILLTLPGIAQADAWWGEGYRKPDWVRANGGTIVYYAIKGKKSSDRYKARMYQGGERIEIEYGSSGVFDDAKNGAYNISAYEGSKKIGTVNFSACPGGTLYANFDVKKKSASISGCRRKVQKQVKTNSTTQQKNQEKIKEQETAQDKEALRDKEAIGTEEKILTEKTDESKEEVENIEEENTVAEMDNLSQSSERNSFLTWMNSLQPFFTKLFHFNFLFQKE
ncbi:MAG: hypothetical protein U9Q72_02330 [Patescibacteria group bacterium]|nr:hypothetical protein [Patescibacteria group bacterium]